MEETLPTPDAALTPDVGTTEPERTADVEQVVAHRRLRTLFQPLVRLEDRRVIGYEALTRGPHDTALESPVALFDAARTAGILPELDWACRASALQAALDSGLADHATWFVNVEATALGTACPDDLWSTIEEGSLRLDIVVELTERDLVGDPAGLLATVRWLRDRGLRVALDDVGAEPASLALLPLIEPDVIKLDMRLVNESSDAEVTAIVNAVRAHAESTGAVVLAEGIENDHDHLVAETMGATLGQGWLFGRPAEITARAPAKDRGGLPVRARPRTDSAQPDRTPFEVVSKKGKVGLTQKRLLLPISHHLENQSATGPTPGVLLACVEHARYFPPWMLDRYVALASGTAFTAIFGCGLADTGAGFRAVDLAPEDPLASEWNVIVLGAHFAAALVARDLHDDGPDDQRRFHYAVTHDRPTVVESARSLLAWCTRAPS